MSITADIDTDRLIVNGHSLRDARPVPSMHELLGPPDRIEAAGPPAPVGHRNNQIHIYDRAGLYLNEHHFTCLISAITFVLWKEEATFRIDHELVGTVTVGGIPVKPGSEEVELRTSTIPFVSHLPGTWSCSEGGLWIGFESKGRRLPSGRRSKRRRLVSLSVCLEHEPWDTSSRPG